MGFLYLRTGQEVWIFITQGEELSCGPHGRHLALMTGHLQAALGTWHWLADWVSGGCFMAQLKAQLHKVVLSLSILSRS